MNLYNVKPVFAILFYVLSFPLFIACSQVGKESELAKPIIDIADSASRIRYSGKGAGASAMLMSSMGPAGVAIGVAIDEGIAKDIHTAFVNNGYDLNVTIETGITSGIDRMCLGNGLEQVSFDCKNGNLVAHVEKVALRAKPNEGDSVIADIKMRFTYAGIVYRLDSKADELCTKNSELLDNVKTDGSKTNKLITTCVTELTVFGLGRLSSL